MSKAWFITGGSSGIGLSLGRHVLRNGSHAVLTTRNVDSARSSAPDIEERGGKWLQLDLSAANLESLVEDAVEREGIDTVVNNAGYAQVSPVENCNPRVIRDIYETNLIAPIRICQAVTPIFRQRKAGMIVNIGSAVSYTAVPAIAIYGSTKSALRTVTEGLSAELAPFNIRVLLIEPGAFRTPFGSHGIIGEAGAAYKDTPVDHVMSNLGKRPSKGNPEEAAKRIWEVATKTGMAEGNDKVTSLTRIPLGSDSMELLDGTVKAWTEVGEKVRAFAKSTDHED